MPIKKTIAAILGATLVIAAAALGYAWFFCRVYVEPGEMLVLTRKSGAEMPADQKIAEEGQKGIQRIAPGPGRYFFNPFTWEWETHRLIEVPAGDPESWREVYAAGVPDYQVPKSEGAWPKVGVVTSLAGQPWDQEIEVVEPGYQGIWRAVLTPGTYRLNPLAYKVELRDAVVVPLGCVGVMTSLLGDMPDKTTVVEKSIGPDGEPVEGERKIIQELARKGQRGVLKDVLPPGLYYLNPYVHKVKIVQVGYNQLSQLETEEMKEIIRFPSHDGYTIQIEVTVVWGRHPEHAPEMIARFGEVEKLKQIVMGQIRSICRNIGSKFASTDFIRGERREEYQNAVTETLRNVAEQRDIEILIALIQNIEVHGGSEAPDQEDLKSTIQRRYIAKEEEETRIRQQETAKVRAQLEMAKAEIPVAREQIAAETRKKVAELLADANKQAEEIDAQRDLEVAKIERQIAELEAEQKLVLGRAEAEVEELKNRAEAQGQALMIKAFGSGGAYNLYTFAQNFQPESIRLIFAGEGTFWTDLNRLQDAADLELLRTRSESRAKESARPRP